jgi:hypothetical protein
VTRREPCGRKTQGRDYAAFVRYCFEDPSDAAMFRSRFEPKVERFKLAG